MCQSCDDSPENPPVERRNFLKLAGAAALGLAFANSASAATPDAPPQTSPVSPDAALARLIRGNARYVAGTMKPRSFVPERASMVSSQYPFAAILGCADSRVSTEFAFDTGRGDLFVCRVAGNFANKDTIASFEYAVAVLGVPVIMVLGHQNCGAVDAAVKAVKDGATYPGHIPSLIKALSPAVVAVKDQQGDLLMNAIRKNVLLNVEALKSASPILNEAYNKRALKIVGGIYTLSDGKVSVIS